MSRETLCTDVFRSSQLTKCLLGFFRICRTQGEKASFEVSRRTALKLTLEHTFLTPPPELSSSGTQRTERTKEH